MPQHLWEDLTTGAVETTVKAFKRLNRANYDAHVGELIGFADGDHASYMAGDTQVKNEDLTLNGNSDPNCYFQKFLPRNWDRGQGGMVPQYLPFLRRLVQIKATLFHRHPTLSLIAEDGTADDASTKTLRDVLRKMRFTTRCKKLQKRVELVNTAFAYVRWDGAQVQLDVITPDNVEIYPDPNDPANLDKALLIRHRLPSLQDSPSAFPERWMVWERVPGLTPAADEWFVYVMDNGWQELDNPGFPDNINPYRAFPIVVFNSEEQQDCIFQQLDDTLLTAQVGLDILATWYMDQQPDGLHVFKTTDSELPKNLPTGRSAAIPLGPADSHEWHNIPMDAGAMKTYLEMTLKAHASLHGITPDVFSLESEAFTTALTGLAAQMDRWDVQEVREDQEAYWEYKLDALELKIAMVHNSRAPSSQRIDTTLQLLIEWAQPEAPVDPQSQAQTRTSNIAARIASPVDYIMEDHNITNRDEAMDRARMIAAEINELGAAPAQMETADDEDEDNG